MKKILLNFAFWILNRYKVNYFLYPQETEQLAINSLVDQVESKFKSECGEFKRAQVMRAAMNSIPHLKERDIAFCIELAVRRVS